MCVILLRPPPLQIGRQGAAELLAAVGKRSPYHATSASSTSSSPLPWCCPASPAFPPSPTASCPSFAPCSSSWCGAPYPLEVDLSGNPIPLDSLRLWQAHQASVAVEKASACGLRGGGGGDAAARHSSSSMFVAPAVARQQAAEPGSFSSSLTGANSEASPLLLQRNSFFFKV